jgi:hypothetical protein
VKEHVKDQLMMLQMLQLRAKKVTNCDHTRDAIGCWHFGKAHRRAPELLVGLA